jgi:hypothetical protein
VRRKARSARLRFLKAVSKFLIDRYVFIILSILRLVVTSQVPLAGEGIQKNERAVGASNDREARVMTYPQSNESGLAVSTADALCLDRHSPLLSSHLFVFDGMSPP